MCSPSSGRVGEVDVLVHFVGYEGDPQYAVRALTSSEAVKLYLPQAYLLSNQEDWERNVSPRLRDLVNELVFLTAKHSRRILFRDAHAPSMSAML